MAFFAGVGRSRQIQNAHLAGNEAAKYALENSRQQDAHMVVVFASSLYDQEELIKGVRDITKDAPLIGCTAAGVITPDGPEEQAVAVLVIKSDTTFFHPIKVEKISGNMREAGKTFGNAVQSESGNKARLAFVFSDALSGNGTELVRGVFEILGTDFHLVGGAAGDDMHFKKTYQYFNGTVLSDAAVGFAMSGNVRFASGADHGWQPVGNPRTVTKAEGTTLYELDGKPAFEIYKDSFGERASEFKNALSLAAVSSPLGMEVEGSDQFMIRVPLAVKDDGSIVCGAEVLVGSKIYLMIGTVASALDAAEKTVKRLVAAVPNAYQRVIFVSDCVARKILLGERGRDEILLLKNIGGRNSEVFGFYSYGQISPLNPPIKDVHTCDPGFYEQSISIGVFGE